MAQLWWGLDALGVKYVPSVANFVLIELGRDAQEIASQLLHLGVFVRSMSGMGFPGAIRVTVGTREENDAFLQALAKVQATGTSLAEKTKKAERTPNA